MHTIEWVALAWIGLALLLFPLQLRIIAPYGRHASDAFGPSVDNRLGWVVMEVVSPLLFGTLFLAGANPKTAPMWVFFGLWMAHYLHRSLIFPFRLRGRGKRMPLLIMLSAVLFNLVNGALNGHWLGQAGPVYDPDWLADPRFVVGLLLFVGGASINLWADDRLIRLRKGSEGGYRIPRGGLFEWVSCPNHLGEILEWTGFACMCWNLPALSFAVWTAGNLIPRSLAHHRWYRRHFPDYPEGRKAVLPGLW